MGMYGNMAITNKKERSRYLLAPGLPTSDLDTHSYPTT